MKHYYDLHINVNNKMQASVLLLQVNSKTLYIHYLRLSLLLYMVAITRNGKDDNWIMLEYVCMYCMFSFLSLHVYFYSVIRIIKLGLLEHTKQCSSLIIHSRSRYSLMVADLEFQLKFDN